MRRTYATAILLSALHALSGCAALGAAMVGPSKDAALAALDAGAAALKAGIDSARASASIEIEKAAVKAEGAIASAATKLDAALEEKARELEAKRDAALAAGKTEEAGLWDSLLQVLAGLGIGTAGAYRFGLLRGVKLEPSKNGGAPKA